MPSPSTPVPGLDRPPAPFYVPPRSVVERSQLTEFIDWCAAQTRTAFPDEEAFYRFSVEEGDRFWAMFLEWSGLIHEGDPDPVRVGDDVEHATYFPGVRLSFAENLLSSLHGPDDQPAVTAIHEGGGVDRLTRGELRDRVVAAAVGLRGLGIAPGDRVVAVMPNAAESVVAGLAVAAVGGVLATGSPEMGAPALLSRFQQLEPVALVFSLRATGQVPAAGLMERLVETVAGLPTVRSIVLLDDEPAPVGLRLPVHHLDQLISASREAAAGFTWPRFDFNHPLFVLFSSGTTGTPKCIVHGAGGTLLEQVKEHRLHGDVRDTDTMLFQTSTAWMIWHKQLNTLACGARIVLYDGRIQGPETLWRIVADERVTVFGTSPPYLRLTADAGYSPRASCSLGSLRLVMSSGSVLHDEQFDWIRDHVGHLPVQTTSGGSDIMGAFVLGSPNRPVYRGEAQCRSLGLDVQALIPPNAPAGTAIGELVCRKPFPSRPLGFHGDVGGVRFHEAYFAANPGVWTHGDLLELTATGGARIHGRSDGVLNVNGIRIGPSEIYEVLRGIPDILDAIVVEQLTPDRPTSSRLVLVVVMRRAGTLDRAMRSSIRRELIRHASRSHVPELIVEVAELPVTHSDKRSEAAVRDALNGRAAANLHALRNPASLDEIVRRVREADDARAPAAGSVPQGSTTLEHELRSIWEDVLRTSPIGRDEDFFELGGSSLLAGRVVTALHARTGHELPLSAVLTAPTIATLAHVITAGPGHAPSPLVLLKSGSSGVPLYLVSGLLGDVLNVGRLAASLETDRPVYGLRALGLEPGQTQHTSVEEMAEYYIDHIRLGQPTGPYALAGYSLGGLVALEMARRLTDAGERIAYLGVIDTRMPRGALTRRESVRYFATLPYATVRWAIASPRRTLAAAQRLLGRTQADRYEAEGAELPAYLRAHVARALEAFRRYRPGAYAGTATFFRAARRPPTAADPVPTWRRIVSGGVTVIELGGEHLELLAGPHVMELARLLDRSMDAASA